MSRILVLFAFTLVFLASCNIDDGTTNTDTYKSEGVITGRDYGMCMCCGGWFIIIDSVKYRFLSLPEGNALNLTDANYPVKVLLDWKNTETPCQKTEIIVTRIKKI